MRSLFKCFISHGFQNISISILCRLYTCADVSISKQAVSVFFIRDKR